MKRQAGILTGQWAGVVKIGKRHEYLAHDGQEKVVFNFFCGGLKVAAFGKQGEYFAEQVTEGGEFVVFFLGQERQSSDGSFINWVVQGFRRLSDRDRVNREDSGSPDKVADDDPIPF